MVGYGILDVVFGLYLVAAGFSVVQVGVLVTCTLIGSAVLNFAIALVGDRIGRRGALSLTTILMAGAGLILLSGLDYPWQIVAMLTGTLNFTAPSTSGFVAVEQSILPQITPAGAVNRAFGRYNMVTLISRMLGALIAGLPEIVARSSEIDLLLAYRVILALFVALCVVSLAGNLLLSPRVEVQTAAREVSRPLLPLERSRGPVLRLSALFGIDALSSGFIAQSLLVLWFFERFGASAALMGPVFSVARLIQVISYHVAMRLVDRFGLLRTMVFTHLPSQFLLLGMAAAPTLPVALALLLLRQGLSHMDVPIRQAYLTALVPPEERTAAAGVSNLTRNLAESVSPSITGAAFQSLAYSLPIVLSAVSGIIYDVALYVSFRQVKLASDELALTE